MTKVLIASQPNGTLQNRAGDAQIKSVEFRQANGTAPNHFDGTLVTHYADVAGTDPSTAAFTADNRGRLMRWIEAGSYKQIVDPGTSAAESLDFHATPGSVESNSKSGLLVGAQRTVVDSSPFAIDLSGATNSDAGFAAFVAACAGRRGFLPDGTIKLTADDALVGASRTHIELAPGCTLDFSGAAASRRFGSWSGTGGDGTTKVPLTANVAEGATSLSVAAGAEAAFPADSTVKVRSHAKYDPNRTRGQVGEMGQVASTASGVINLDDQIIASDPARDVTGVAATDILTPSGWAVTGTASNDSVTFTSHGMSTGDKVNFLSLTGGAGLTAGTTYYVIFNGISSIKLAASLADAQAGTAINFTTDITAAVLAMEHGLVANDQIILETLTGGAGLTDGLVVFVVSPTATTFQVSLTSGGAAIDFTTDLTNARYRRSSVAYAIGDDAWVELVTMLEDITIEGRGTILGGGTGDAHECLRFTTCRNVRVRDLRVRGFQADAFVFDDCLDFEVACCHVEDCDSATVGYGVSVSNTSTDGKIHRNHFRGCRHSFTTGQNSRGGLPRWIKFDHNFVHNSVNSGDAVDTHASGELIEIMWNVIHDSSSQGINVECSHAVVMHNTISRTADHGIAIHNETGAISEYVCSHNTVKNPGSSHNCIRFTSVAGGLGVSGSIVRWIKIEGNRCEYAGTQSIVVNSTHTWRFTDVMISNNTIVRQVGTNQGIYLLKTKDCILGINSITEHPPTATGIALSDCINTSTGKTQVNYRSLSTGIAALITDCIGCEVDVQSNLAGTACQIVANSASSSTDCTCKVVVTGTATTGFSISNNAVRCSLASGSNLNGTTTPIVPGTGTGHVFATCPPRPHTTVHASDANFTYTPNTSTAPEMLRLTVPITAIRTVTLSTTQAARGTRLRVVRAAAATGASAWNVGTGPLKALAVSQWCDVSVDPAGAWVLDGFGSL